MADRKAFLLRLDFGLFQQIAERAKSDLRSINREIEFLLREGISRQEVRSLPSGTAIEELDTSPPDPQIPEARGPAEVGRQRGRESRRAQRH